MMRHVQLTLAVYLLTGGAYVQADNLEQFIFPVSHPICGYNPDFDERPRNVPTMPFATCRTLAIGYSIKELYPEPGLDALSKLIIAMSEPGGWEQRFGPLNQLSLKCMPARPLGFPQASPGMVPGVLPAPQASPGMVPGVLPAPQASPGMVPGVLPAPQTSPGMVPGVLPAPQASPGMVPGGLPAPQASASMVPGQIPAPKSLPDVGSVPICTHQFVQNYISQYEAQPIVSSYKILETKLRDLDLNDMTNVQKLRQATAVVRMAGQTITFDEITKLLE